MSEGKERATMDTQEAAKAKGYVPYDPRKGVEEWKAEIARLEGAISYLEAAMPIVREQLENARAKLRMWQRIVRREAKRAEVRGTSTAGDGAPADRR